MTLSQTLVLKFGGSSCSKVEQFDDIAKIILERSKIFSHIVVVLSAMGDTTDRLIEMALSVNAAPPQREKDMLVSVGERISCALLAMALDKRGASALSLTGSQSGIITTCEHSNAQIVTVRPDRIKKFLEKGRIVIVAGFQGVSLDKEITTLGRGGSDTSAVALAVALGAARVEFYKDVPGIYAKDPKIFPEKEPIKELGYEQALAIAKEGGVVHPRAVLLAQKNKKPLWFFSHLDIERGRGTVIQDSEMATAFQKQLYECEELEKTLPPYTPFFTEKAAIVQRRLAHFVSRFPLFFNEEMIRQMQHFLIVSHRAFQDARTPAHLMRIIYNFYRFKKVLIPQKRENPTKRYLEIRLRRVHLESARKREALLAVCVGFNLLKENEVFDEKHLIKAFQRYFPTVRATKDSFFGYDDPEYKIRLVYLEIEKEDGVAFSDEQIKLLQDSLPLGLKNQVAHLISPVFMPRNEEEVMRNLITLSKQLKLVKDPVHLMISFEEQCDSEITFAVQLSRVISSKTAALPELFRRAKAAHGNLPQIIADRVRAMGPLKKNYQKEVAALRVKFSRTPFTREDHSIDLYKARLYVAKAFELIFGKIRDYNGGLYTKEMETFLELCQALGQEASQSQFLLENLFHSIYPVDLKGVANPLCLKKLFLLFKAQIDPKSATDLVIKDEEEGIYAVALLNNPASHSKMEEKMRQQFGTGLCLLSCSILDAGVLYVGYIYFAQRSAKRSEIKKKMQEKIQECLTGEKSMHLSLV